MLNRFSIGQTFRTKLRIDETMVQNFAEFSGDRNPIHIDAEEARSYGYPRPVAHGAILITLLSRLIGMEVPGSGALWLSHSVDWMNPVFVGDEIELTVSVEKISVGAGILFLAAVATNREGKTVMKGAAKVKVRERLTRPNQNPGNTKRVALVTGGSRGIGAAIARRLAAAGMMVAINCNKSAEAAQQVVEEISAAGGSAEVFAADLSDSSAASRMVQDIAYSLGRLDVVVHGASPTIPVVNLSDLTYADFERYLRIYLGGAVSLVAGAQPAMTERKFGRFIFLGTAAMFGTPPVGWAAYVAAKQALWGFVKCLATELGPTNITTNMVSPGMTVTDLTAEIPARVKEVEARKNPMRRLATADDTAEVVAFLASDVAGYVNGANIPVVGGPL